MYLNKDSFIWQNVYTVCSRAILVLIVFKFAGNCQEIKQLDLGLQLFLCLVVIKRQICLENRTGQVSSSAMTVQSKVLRFLGYCKGKLPVFFLESI